MNLCVNTKESPACAGLSSFELCFVLSYRPKKSQSRMITGIGTPTSHNKSPFPIFASIAFLKHVMENIGKVVLFLVAVLRYG